MHVLHINTDTHTHRNWWNPYSNGSYVTGIRNQYLPRWCGTCWAQAVTIALSDRLKILCIRAGTNLADGNLSPQPLLDCSIADDTKVFCFSIAQTIKRLKGCTTSTST